jgi:hypothetical protein
MITRNPIIKLWVTVCFAVALASVAQAQANRTWVSGTGDDTFPCSRTSPCKTFSGAITKTATNGEINCLDPGGFGAVTITKSIQIDCHEVYAGVVHPATNGVSIAFDSFVGSDVRRQVRLRNLNFSGFDTGTRGISITGSSLANNGEVYIEDCMMDGNFASTGHGIRDGRNGGGLLSVSNTTIRNMVGPGIATAAGFLSGTTRVVLNKVQVLNCSIGVALSTNTKATISDSVIVGNTTGIFSEDLDGGVIATEVAVDHCVVSKNGTGFNGSTNSTIRVSHTTAMNNTSALFSGNVLSYGNNQTGGAAFGGSVLKT